ncbi:MAG: HEPN domain-containing protein [Candidatus Latescibacteria bacterium]|nr:HEPN domain-containing protein [Candidatus Latescibacterota bacterium]
MKEATGKFLGKADRVIQAAERMLACGDAEFAVGRVYYAMFYMAEALLNEKGFRFRKHGGVHGAFGEHFVKTGEFDPKYHRWLLEAFNKRITGDYGVEAVIPPEEVGRMIEQAHEFLQAVHRYLGLLAADQDREDFQPPGEGEQI